jgi:hypothetical protein
MLFDKVRADDFIVGIIHVQVFFADGLAIYQFYRTNIVFVYMISFIELQSSLYVWLALGRGTENGPEFGRPRVSLH